MTAWHMYVLRAVVGLVAASAFVSIWGGWVGLGGLAGFGPVNLLPGIGDGMTVDLAITLPLGIESYAAIALYVAVSGIVTGSARLFAWCSAVGALLLGAVGQSLYHVLTAEEGGSAAPLGVVIFVSVLPVAVLGLASVLLHLAEAAHRGAREEAASAAPVTDEDAPLTAEETPLPPSAATEDETAPAPVVNTSAMPPAPGLAELSWMAPLPALDRQSASADTVRDQPGDTSSPRPATAPGPPAGAPEGAGTRPAAELSDDELLRRWVDLIEAGDLPRDCSVNQGAGALGTSWRRANRLAPHLAELTERVPAV